MTPSSGSGTATVTFAYRNTSQELNGNTANALQVFKCVGGTWVQQSGTPTYGTAGAYNIVTLGGVSIGSGYALGSNTPTAVTLSEFSARVVDNNPALPWVIGVMTLATVGGIGYIVVQFKRR